MNKAIAQLGFTILLFFLFIYSAIEATSFKQLAKYFPLYISIIAAILLLIEIIRQIIKLKENKEKGEQFHPNLKGAFKYTLYLIVYVLLVYLIGFVLASIIYVFVFLYFIAKMRLISSIITVAVLVGLMIMFGDAMNLYWPKSLFHILTII